MKKNTYLPGVRAIYIFAGVFLTLVVISVLGSHRALACSSCLFSSYPGQASTPASNTVLISNSTSGGGQSANWTASVNYSSGSNWLPVIPLITTCADKVLSVLLNVIVVISLASLLAENETPVKVCKTRP